jgi:hypothetical protein
LWSASTTVVVKLLTGTSTPEDTVAAESALYKEITLFDQFRNDLRKCFETWQIPTGLCDDDDRWFDFVAAYTHVIEDGSLVAKNKQLVDTVRFTKGQATPGADPRHLAHKWLIFFNQPFKGHSGIALTVQVPPNCTNVSRTWSLF